ncbi:OTU domain-containing protein [Streptomyces bottropensis]|uniref:hypothetical protein n=1 Tax=Streptomyces bottropensis TaxID=42235 RepID=UPI0036AB5C70
MVNPPRERPRHSPPDHLLQPDDQVHGGEPELAVLMRVLGRPLEQFAVLCGAGG